MYRDLLGRATLLLAGAMAGTLAACGGGGGDAGSSLAADDPASASAPPTVPVPPSVTRIGVMPSNDTTTLSSTAIAIASDGSLQFTVDVLPVGASNAVTWTVSGASCAAAA